MKTRLTKNEIIHRLKEEKPFLIQNFGVVDIGLFGSFAPAMLLKRCSTNSIELMMS
ncbi:hypothetical protein ACFLYZ_01395 [Thermodesulfobacteriota bacterium]